MSKIVRVPSWPRREAAETPKRAILENELERVSARIDRAGLITPCGLQVQTDDLARSTTGVNTQSSSPNPGAARSVFLVVFNSYTTPFGIRIPPSAGVSTN